MALGTFSSPLLCLGRAFLSVRIFISCFITATSNNWSRVSYYWPMACDDGYNNNSSNLMAFIENTLCSMHCANTYYFLWPSPWSYKLGVNAVFITQMMKPRLRFTPVRKPGVCSSRCSDLVILTISVFLIIDNLWLFPIPPIISPS